VGHGWLRRRQAVLDGNAVPKERRFLPDSAPVRAFAALRKLRRLSLADNKVSPSQSLQGDTLLSDGNCRLDQLAPRASHLTLSA
jgi:hypothetical protein